MNPPAPMPPFAAVLLAGGRSRRMGRDKALLPLPDGRALWERQWAVLRALEPAELFVSGSWREGMPAWLPWLADEFPGCGPLAGIAAALGAMRSRRLVVLAVDLPAMTAEFLGGLLREGDVHAGRVLRQAEGYFEPLAAVYPRAAAEPARESLRAGTFALQPFVRALVTERFVTERPIREEEAALFTNWNRPEDQA